LMPENREAPHRRDVGIVKPKPKEAVPGSPTRSSRHNALRFPLKLDDHTASRLDSSRMRTLPSIRVG